MCTYLELTQDSNPSLLRMVLLSVGHELHWTIINLMPIIALALVETSWGNTKDTTLVSNKDLGCSCPCSSPPSRFPTHRPSCPPLRSSPMLTLIAVFLAVPLVLWLSREAK
ncbi:hypothetical protein BKA70DRAFT_1284221 [Coprinopsis sp. MPI-PUGE-AT-0042]|nr:hypothetical protein BKA70DRAFT_1284221 [Coprinopsis sp. MPI-PUGE-AT-0042]